MNAYNIRRVLNYIINNRVRSLIIFGLSIIFYKTAVELFTMKNKRGK